MTSYCPSISQEICQNISCIGSTNSFNNPHEFRNSRYDSTNRTNSFNNPHEFRNSLYDSTNHTNSFNNPHEFRNSLYDFHHHRASDAFQGPIYSAHKPAISPEQTNHVSDTIQEAHQMTGIITPLHLLPTPSYPVTLPPTTQHQPKTPHSPPGHT